LAFGLDIGQWALGRLALIMLWGRCTSHFLHSDTHRILEAAQLLSSQHGRRPHFRARERLDARRVDSLPPALKSQAVPEGEPVTQGSGGFGALPSPCAGAALCRSSMRIALRIRDNDRTAEASAGLISRPIFAMRPISAGCPLKGDVADDLNARAVIRR